MSLRLQYDFPRGPKLIHPLMQGDDRYLIITQPLLSRSVESASEMNLDSIEGKMTIDDDEDEVSAALWKYMTISSDTTGGNSPLLALRPRS